MRESKNAAATCLLLLIFTVVWTGLSIANDNSRGLCGPSECGDPPVYDLTKCPEALSKVPHANVAERCGEIKKSCFGTTMVARDETCRNEWLKCVAGAFQEKVVPNPDPEYNRFLRACRNDLQRRLDQEEQEEQKKQDEGDPLHPRIWRLR